MGFDSRSEFHLQIETWEKMSLFLELISAHIRILIIKNKDYQFLVKEQHKN